jgi:hypothetical protein
MLGAVTATAVAVVFAVVLVAGYATYKIYHAIQGHDLMRSVID